MTVTHDRGAVFVMPRRSTEWADAPAMWITVAGWADAAQRAFGSAWIVTRDRVASPGEALSFTRPRVHEESSTQDRKRIPAPLLVRTAVKDAVRARDARRRSDAGERSEWQSSTLEFVWQHHDPFHSAGEPLARRHRVPLVTYVHAPQIWESARWGVRRPGWGRLIERYGERPPLVRSDVVACVSDEVAEEVIRLGVRPTRVLVSPMAVDAHRFTPGLDGERVRQELGLAGKFVVGWTGSFRRFHGLDRAIEAFGSLVRVAPESHLMLVGDGPERTALEARARALGIDGDVTFAGAVAHEALPEYLVAMDATVVTANEQDAFHYSPLKMREYMASARPVVAPRVGDVARMITNELDGLLYEPTDTSQLAAALLELRNDPALRRELGAAGRALVERTSTWDTRIEQLLESEAYGESKDRKG